MTNYDSWFSIVYIMSETEDIVKILRRQNAMGKKVDDLVKQISVLQYACDQIESKLDKISDKIGVKPEVSEVETDGGDFKEKESSEVLNEFLDQPQGIKSIRIKK